MPIDNEQVINFVASIIRPLAEELDNLNRNITGGRGKGR